jgi:hypothetical protein
VFPLLCRGLQAATVGFALVWAVFSSTRAAEIPAEQADFFEKSVRPVLVKHCYECHSESADKIKGGLVLDTKAGWERGGDSGPAIVPGDPEKSLLIGAVRHADKDLKMPKEKIAEHEIAALSDWVKMGAPDPRTGPAAAPRPAFDWDKERQHWSYQPIRDSAVPSTDFAEWNTSPIDRFVHAKLREQQLEPVGLADKRTLLRRATFDLIGLPPSPGEMAAFLADASPDAFEKVVDRLLASPHYGERWGRHWMDLVRYADTAGDNSDYPIPQAYLYRNYVIAAFNADKPYDQFIREQIAGDLLPAQDQTKRNEQVIATGYLAISRRFGSVVDRYPHHLTIEDTIDNLGKTFMGLTVSCARCHDHKFDAITQRDYYGIYGIFASSRYPFPGIELDKVPKHFVPLVPKEEVEAAIAPHRQKEEELEKQRKDSGDKVKALERERLGFKRRIESAQGEEIDKLESEARDLDAVIDRAKKERDEIARILDSHRKNRPRFPDAYAMQEDKPADAKMHLKGEPDRLGEVVPRRWFELFGGEVIDPAVAASTSGRLQLANWITDPKNPLTSRILVNRLWHYHFGAGLVKTASDFGVRGLPPSNGDLLDFLASRFIEGGWSIKKMHRLIMLSRTYQLASTDHSENATRDPENRYHWRYERRRLDAESLRDTLLTLSGSLDPSPQKEPHPFPPVEKWEFTQHHPFHATYPSTRRSVYLMGARLNALPFFQTFDGPDRNATTPSRDSSVTTVQALYFMNDESVHEQAERFAERICRDATGETERLNRAFSLALQRIPTEDEQERVREYFAAARGRLEEMKIPEDQHDKTPWAGFARSLFRTNEFLYVD